MVSAPDTQRLGRSSLSLPLSLLLSTSWTTTAWITLLEGRGRGNGAVFCVVVWCGACTWLTHLSCRCSARKSCKKGIPLSPASPHPLPCRHRRRRQRCRACALIIASSSSSSPSTATKVSCQHRRRHHLILLFATCGGGSNDNLQHHDGHHRIFIVTTRGGGCSGSGREASAASPGGVGGKCGGCVWFDAAVGSSGGTNGCAAGR